MSEVQTLTIRPPVWALLLAVVIAGGFYIYGKQLDTQDHTPVTISVTGEGKVSAAPDIAELTFGVQTEPRASAKDAMDGLQTVMNKIFTAVKATGVADQDIATDQFSLSPSYDWSNGQQRLQGYAASQTLRVKVRDLSKVSQVLSAATDAGANQAGDVNFTIDDPEKIQSQAREKAVAQAKEKALTLATDLGMSLGKMKDFSEGSTPTPIFYNSMDKATVGGNAPVAVPSSTPLPPGQQDVVSDVTITYELK